MIRLPWLQRLLKPKVPYAQSNPTNAERFTDVFQTKRWLVDQSVSGPGSDRQSGSVIHTLEVLEKVCADHDVRSIADIPCGDFNWMPTFLKRHPEIDYVGYDIVQDLIDQNLFHHPNQRFELLDVVAQVPPPADLILCKDLINHLFERDVWSALENMSNSGSKLILITSNAGYPNAELNMRGPGASRELNLMAAPYRMPEPLYADHYLSLWPTEAIAARVAERRAETAI